MSKKAIKVIARMLAPIKQTPHLIGSIQQHVSPLVSLVVHSQRQQQHMKAPSSSFYSTSLTNLVDFVELISAILFEETASSVIILLVASSPFMASAFYASGSFIPSIVLMVLFLLNLILYDSSFHYFLFSINSKIQNLKEKC